MRWYEIISENASAGATAAGSVASVVKPLGATLRRVGYYPYVHYDLGLTKSAKKKRKKKQKS